jgi:glycosyltransferase involved in cell wall biosynthesis
MNPRPLHVLVATPLGRGGKGGMDRVMDALADEFARSRRTGLNVRFAATRGSGHILLSPFYLAMFVARILWLRLTGRCDLLHINLTSRGSTSRKLVVAKLARALAIPYVLHLHGGSYPDFYKSLNAIRQARIRELFSRARIVLVLGHAWRDFVVREHLARAENVAVIRNACPRRPAKGAADGDAVRILYLGVLKPLKGVPELVQALTRLKERSGWTAVLAGSGDVASLVTDLTAAGIAYRVSVPGWLAPLEIDALLASSDILVLPSFVENLPMSVIEAMSAGLAVVATPVGATPEIVIDGETGILVQPGDVEQLTRALLLLIEDRSLRMRLGNNAREFHHRHLDIEGAADQLAQLWRDAAAMRAASFTR